MSHLTVSEGFYTVIMVSVEWLSPNFLDCTWSLDLNYLSSWSWSPLLHLYQQLRDLLVSRWAWVECFRMEKASFPHYLHLYSNGHFNDAVTKKNTRSFQYFFVTLSLFRPEFSIAAFFERLFEKIEFVAKVWWVGSAFYQFFAVNLDTIKVP